MRDYETIETAMTAAETGHLVMSTLHTMDAAETVNRIIGVFPPTISASAYSAGKRSQGVISQRLVPKSDGKGRVPLWRSCWYLTHPRMHRRQGKDQTVARCHCPGLCQLCMQTFDQSLMKLYTAN